MPNSSIRRTRKNSPAKDVGCASPIDDLGALVSELDVVLGSNGPGTGAAAEYGALAGFLDQDAIAARVKALSASQRMALAGKLLTVALDPTLTGACDKDQVRYNAAMVLFELAKNASSSSDRRCAMSGDASSADASVPTPIRRRVLDMAGVYTA